MSSTVFWRALVAALLALALPLQALAGLSLCGLAAMPVAVASSKAKSEALPPCHDMVASAEFAVGDRSGADAGAGTGCSACAAAACCHAPALLPSVQTLRLPAQSLAPECAPAAARERMLTGGLDRPPRRA